MSQWMAFIFLGALGVSIEILFTSVCASVLHYRKGEPFLALEGVSNVWVFFLYGSAAFFFPLLYPLVGAWPTLARAAAYAGLILSVEWLAGWVLDRLTGRCPWEYDAPLAVSGYIRLDYFPLWAALGLILEQVCLGLQ